jgi:hypothetical protein
VREFAVRKPSRSPSVRLAEGADVDLLGQIRDAPEVLTGKWKVDVIHLMAVHVRPPRLREEGI